MNDLKTQFEAVVRKELNRPELAIAPEVPIQQIPGWDSLAHVMIIGAIEKEFGVEFTLLELANMTSAGAILRCLETKV